MIVRLPKILVDQIAAGEVVVRPASVVKELVENSIDAQPRHITVAVGNGLRDISVGDDGAGMSADDAPLALERHATSKIRSLDDLHAIRTRGFRGEALPSIAAVSRLTLTTRRPEDLAATRVVVEGGQIGAVETVGAPPGTSVTVRDLFYNTPARLKFLKTAATELGQVIRAVVRQALAAPSVAFRLVQEERLFLDLPADQPLLSRAQQLLGTGADGLLEVGFEKYDVRIRGFVAKPAEARRDRRHQFFLINGRPISDRTLAYAVEQAYEGLILSQRFPVLVLSIELDPQEVDVNVHPTKEEVRFREEKKIVGLLNRAVVEALRAANLLPNARLPEMAAPQPPGQTAPAAPVNYEELFRKAGEALRLPATPYQGPAPSRPASSAQGTPPAVRVATVEMAVAQESPAAAPDQETVFAGDIPPPTQPSTLAVHSPPRAIGQVADTYIVAQTGQDLLIIDQHAAHERLLYWRSRQHQGPLATQPLLVPITVEVRPTDRPLMEEMIPVLGQLGFETEAFGGQTFLVRSVPALFEQIDVPALIHDLLDDLAQSGLAREGQRLREHVLTQLACHAAIKAGQPLQTEEMQRLIDDLMAARLAFTCPHGRPTMILLTRDQLDRQFKRK